MRVTGLKHQWGDQLFVQFEPDPEAPEHCQKRDLAIQTLLTYLKTVDGPDLWVGTSHSLLNFCARDTRDRDDCVPPLAFVNVVEVNNRDLAYYKIEYPLPREVCPWFETLPGKENPWNEACVGGFTLGVEAATSMLLTAIKSSDNNPSRHRSSWMWYECPKCDFHSPHFNVNCERCGFTFPPEKKTQSIGLYRKVQFSEGASTPTQSGVRSS